MKNTLQILGLCCLLTGCVTAKKINNIEIGMSRESVIKILGNPINTTADRESIYLNYGLTESPGGPPTPYQIRIVNGKVDSYGRAGAPQQQQQMHSTPILIPMVQ